MTQPWGDPEKIEYAMNYANNLERHIFTLVKGKKQHFLKIDNDANERKELLNYIEEKMKNDGYKGSDGTDDLAYLVSVVVKSLFPNNHNEIMKKFFQDGLFKHV